MMKYFFKTAFLFLVTEFFVLFLSHSILFGAEEKGSVAGTVRYFGTIPPRDSVPVNTDPEVCGSIYLEETLVNFENKGVKNAVISLKKKTERMKPSEADKRIYLVSKKCHFEPYVTAIPIDNSLSIKNSDPILHVLQFSKKDQVLFTLPLPANGNFVRRIDQLGLIQIKCVMHPFMKSFIAVLDTPVYTLSDLNGSFHLPELDPGKYNLSIWHKAFGSIEKEIEIPPGKKLDFTFELEQN
ncbi:MAG: hypothetical protein HY202_05025 [Nitrospirae bacterium]|nr:hypothetical protein [Nitrospirota bacterium]